MPLPLASSNSSPKGAIVPIGFVIANGSSNQITFNNIPQNYTDLQLVCSMRSTYAGTADYPKFYYNNDSQSGTSYSYTRIYGDGSGASSGRITNSPNWNTDLSPAANNGAYIFGSFKFDIMNYSNTTTYKGMIGRVAVNLGSSGYTFAYVGTRQSLSAITRIDYVMGLGNFAAGSTFALYGIRSYGQ